MHLTTTLWKTAQWPNTAQSFARCHAAANASAFVNYHVYVRERYTTECQFYRKVGGGVTHTINLNKSSSISYIAIGNYILSSWWWWAYKYAIRIVCKWHASDSYIYEYVWLTDTIFGPGGRTMSEYTNSTRRITPIIERAVRVEPEHTMRESVRRATERKAFYAKIIWICVWMKTRVEFGNMANIFELYFIL